MSGKKARLVQSLTSPSLRIRLHTTEITLGGLLESKSKDITADEAKAVASVCFLALSGTPLGKATRRLLAVIEAVGQLVSGEEEKLEAVCKVVLHTLDRAEELTIVHLKALQHLLRGMCRGTSAELASKKPAPVVSAHDVKKDKKKEGDRGERVQLENTERVLGNSLSCQLLKRVQEIFYSTLPSRSSCDSDVSMKSRNQRKVPPGVRCTTAWLLSCPTLLAAFLDDIKQAQAPEVVKTLPFAACVASVLKQRDELNYDALIVLGEAVVRSVRCPDVLAWSWAEDLLSLPQEHVAACAAKAFEAAAAEAKRALESVLPAFGPCIKILSAHIEKSLSSIEVFVDPLLSSLKDHQLKDLAMKGIDTLITHVKVPEMQKRILTGLGTQIKDAKSNEDKRNCLLTLSTAAKKCMAASDDKAAIINQMYPTLKPLMLTGAVELRHVALGVMQESMAYAEAVPEGLSTSLKELLTGSDDALRHRALTLLPTIAEKDPKKMKDLQTVVAKLCKEGEKKPIYRVDILLALAVVDIQPNEPWYKEGCLGLQPYAFSIDTIRRVTELWELKSIVRSCQRFVPPMSVKSPPPGYSITRDIGPLYLLCLLGTHPRHEISGMACSVLLEAIKADPKLIYPVWTALLLVLWGFPESATPPPAAAAAAAAKPAPKPAGKAAKGKKDDKKGGASADDGKNKAPPFVIEEKKKWTTPRPGIWTLAGELPDIALPGPDRREMPPAAHVFSVVAGELLRSELGVVPYLLAEIVFTAGHPAVSGPETNYTTSSYHLGRYRKEPRPEAFRSLFGSRVVDPSKIYDKDSSSLARLWRERRAVSGYIVTALREAGHRQHIGIASARGLSFFVSVMGVPGVMEAVTIPPVEMSIDGEEVSEKDREEADKAAAEVPRLCKEIENTLAELNAIPAKEMKLALLSDDELEGAVQEKLEDDGVVKKEVPVKKGSKKEDEDWERQLRLKREKELGIEDPKIAKARGEAREELRGVREKTSNVVLKFLGLLKAVHELARARYNQHATHEALPHLVPALLSVLRCAKVPVLVNFAEDTLEWVFHVTPVTEMLGFASTASRLLSVLTRGRGEVAKSATQRFSQEVIAFAECSIIKLRSICSRLLPPPSYSLIFPITEAVLAHTSTPSFSMMCQQQCLTIISTNCGQADLPHRTETSNVLLVALERTPSLAKSATAALTTLAENLRADELEPMTNALISSAAVVRESSIMAFKAYPDLKKAPLKTQNYILASCSDMHKGIERKARELWSSHEMKVDPMYAEHLIPMLFLNESARNGGAAAIAVACKEHPDTMRATMTSMFRAFDAHLSDPATLKLPDRMGVAVALEELRELYTPETLELLTKFCCQRALADIVDDVRTAFLQTFQTVVDRHGEKHHAAVYPVLHHFFQTGPLTTLGPGGPAAAMTPALKELYTAAVVVVMGTLSAKMKKGDHLVPLANRLVDILANSSEVVAKSVCETLATVVQLKDLEQVVPKLAAKCMEKIRGGGPVQQRRSYSYGLAGIIRGRKLPALWHLGVMNMFENCVRGKGAGKEGALLCLGIFCDVFGCMYEPYVVSEVQVVIDSFADKDAKVKAAAEECSKAMMRNLTQFGVRQILPPLLASFESDNWRTKVSALNLLGQMSFCSPQQLSAALPKVMPTLVETLMDTHIEVQRHSWDALSRVGGVIKNPEIANHASILLDAIRDPNKQTDNALEALLCTHFTSAIDAASLAIIEPIIRRGLGQRVAQTKIKAAQILTNIAKIIRDPILVAPYVDGLLKPLKVVLLDEFPTCRSTSSQALGSLVKSLGEKHFPGLLDWCISMLRSPTNSAVERSGAAQGLCEIVGALQSERLEALVVDIKVNHVSDVAVIREGFLQVLVFLPHTLREGFQPYLKELTPCVVRGLSDEVESVRATAVKAGQTIVSLFGMKSLDQLLPPLKEGLFNDKWRVRLSSIQLLGDLLMRVATDNMKNLKRDQEEESEDDEEEEEDEDWSMNSDSDEEGEGKKGGLEDQVHKGPITIHDLRRNRGDKSTNSLVKSLGGVIGTTTLHEVMSAVYMLTADVQPEVAREGKLVWKALVDHTPAMLRSMMTELTALLVEFISEDNEERRVVAAHCLGDLVSKLGDGFLPSILPVLASNLEPSNPVEQRLGATHGLKEVVGCLSRTQLSAYNSILQPCIMKAIKDSDDEVRREAGYVFDVLFKSFGGKTIDGIMRSLIDDASGASENAMEGTLEMVRMRPKAVLNIFIPQLVSEKVLSESSVTGLTKVAYLAEEHMQPHILSLIPILINTLGAEGIEYYDDVVEASQAVIQCAEPDQMPGVIGEIKMFVQSSRAADRRGGVSFIAALAVLDEESNVNIEPFMDVLIQNIIRLFSDPEASVQTAALKAMDQVTSFLTNEGVVQDHLEVVHNSLRSASHGAFGSDNIIPALALPKAMATITPYYLHCLEQGSNDQYEAAASYFAELVYMIPPKETLDAVKNVTGKIFAKFRSKGLEASVMISGMNALITIGHKLPPLKTMYGSMFQSNFFKKVVEGDAMVRLTAIKGCWLMSTEKMKSDNIFVTTLKETVGQHPVVQTSLLRALNLTVEGREHYAGSAKLDENIRILYSLWDSVANVRMASAVGKAVGMMIPFFGADVHEVIERARLTIKEGGAMKVLGFSAWQGLLLKGVGKGIGYNEILQYIEDAVPALSSTTDKEQIHAIVRSVDAFIKGGAYAEVDVTDTQKLIAGLSKVAKLLLEGDRLSTYIEDKIRRIWQEAAPLLPKRSEQADALFSKLAGLEREDWECCSEYCDEERDADFS